MSGHFGWALVPYQDRNTDVSVKPPEPFPEPPRKDTLSYPEKGYDGTSYKLPSGEEDSASIFDAGDSPPLSEEETEDQINRARIDRLEEEIEMLKGNFNPKAWMVHVPNMTGKLVDGATPGSFRHFLLLLLEPDESFAQAQQQVQGWLNERYSRRLIHENPNDARCEVWATDKQQFMGEIEMLRKLVAPLRQEGQVICWMDMDMDRSVYALKLLKKTYNDINIFEDEMNARLTVKNEENLAFSCKADEPKKFLVKMRMVRMDVCNKSLHRVLVSPPAPDPQRKWVPYSAGKPIYGDTRKFTQLVKLEAIYTPKALSRQPTADNLKFLVESTSFAGTVLDVIKTMANIARWLTAARCTEAVDLFCDVARMFSPYRPPGELSDARHSQLRAMCDVMFDIIEISTEPSSSRDDGSDYGHDPDSDYDSDQDDILGSINWDYFFGPSAPLPSLADDSQLQMVAARPPTPPTRPRGYGLNPRGSTVKVKGNGKARQFVIRKRTRSAVDWPGYIAEKRKLEMPADPSNWGVNYTSPFAQFIQEEEEAKEEKEAYHRMRAVYEEKMKSHRRKAKSQAAQTQASSSQLENQAKELKEPEQSEQSEKRKRDLSAHCTGKQASEMITQTLFREKATNTAAKEEGNENAEGKKELTAVDSCRASDEKFHDENVRVPPYCGHHPPSLKYFLRFASLSYLKWPFTDPSLHRFRRLGTSSRLEYFLILPGPDGGLFLSI
ncbi:hypothetical protein AJ79_00407 [Helicocarpus griseus UAMH5409]|uniref:Uncharacterized protein n=1 Tax=Helicocarpus griseus UAMH5409 TaxID=1447875 RepID=A0A2B7YCJ7_9EURO|nr:hypothetical protein AJ79_00407 [Helicocarpus griseus UAMH5409]